MIRTLEGVRVVVILYPYSSRTHIFRYHMTKNMQFPVQTVKMVKN